MEVKRLRMVAGKIIPLCALLTVSACSWLPRAGPYRSDMMAAGDLRHDVAVINVDTSTVGLLQASTSPSLIGTFGETRPPQEQRIGVGDSVQITLWEAGPGGLFSSPVVDRTSPGSRSATIPDQVIANDGSITVPFAGRIRVAGRTPPEIEQAIMQRLTGKAIDPQALVSVTHNVSNTVTVMGQINPGARVPLSVRGDRLLEVIAAAGSIQASISDIGVVLSRDGEVARVPLEAVMDNPRENVFLRAGDVVTLVKDPQSFTAIGAVGQNGLIPFENTHMSLDEALAKAGGLSDERADPAAVFVIRFETADVARQMPQAQGIPVQQGVVPAVYHLDMREPSALFLARRFPVRNKDIIYVSDAPLSDVQKVLTLVNLLVQPAVTGITVNSVVK
jgi:polysaccharide export outer membrane protein